MKVVSVFDYGDLPESEWREKVCDEQPNDSFKKVYFDSGEWDDNDQPLDVLAEIAQWAQEQGAHVEEGDRYPFVLFSISW